MRASDTGESTTSIVRRGDDEAWRKIVVGLACPGHALRRVPKLHRSYLDCGNGPEGAGISDTRLRKLLRSGVLREAGVDRYELAAFPR